MNKYYKKTKPKNKYYEFARVLNGILDLSSRQVDVLALLIQLNSEWPEDDIENKDLLSMLSRRFILKEINMHKSNLTMYSRKLVEKRVILKDEEGRTTLNPLFIPKEVNNKIIVDFEIDFNQDK
jgi:predicted transcriptional regulator